MCVSYHQVFSLSVSLSVPCCRSLHPSLLFFSLGSVYTHTQTNSLNSSTVECITVLHVFLYLCVCFCRCVHHIDLLSLRWYGPLMSSVRMCSTAISVISFWFFRHSDREESVLTVRGASSLPEASNNDSSLKIEMGPLYVEWNYKMISSRAVGCGIM